MPPEEFPARGAAGSPRPPYPSTHHAPRRSPPERNERRLLHDAAEILIRAPRSRTSWRSLRKPDELLDTRPCLPDDCPQRPPVELPAIGNDDPKASVAGEIVPSREFYDYDAKYVDDASELIIPAPLPPATTERVRALSLAAFRAVDARGLARVDFFVERGGERRVWVNEVNTMPGFTPISMYPKLWAASGLPYPALIDRLIELALEEHRDRRDVRAVL